MGRWLSIPKTSYGIIGLVLGIIGSVFWMTQFIWDWWGETIPEKAFFSIMVVLLLLSALGCTYVGNKMRGSKNIFKSKRPEYTVLKVVFLGTIGIILLTMIVNGINMTLSIDYAIWANTTQLGILTGLKQLTSVTSADVSDLSGFALGVKQIAQAFFMIIPAIIATWGGLSVLTADSIDEAEGGILAIIASLVVFFVVFIFKFIDIQLMIQNMFL